MARVLIGAARSAALMVIVIGCRPDCGSSGSAGKTATGNGHEVTEDGNTMAQAYEPVVLKSALGATRLLVSPNGKLAVAELGGAWRADRFLRHDEVPPVLHVVDVAADEVVATANGWALGPPNDAGDLVYLEEHGQEYDYRLRSTSRPNAGGPVEVPDGFWLPRAALGRGDTLVLVMRSAAPGRAWRDTETRAERLWIATIDRASLRVRDSVVITAATWLRRGHRLGEGIALDPARPVLYVTSMPSPEGEGRWRLTAVDLDHMEIAWETKLPLFSEVEVVPLPQPSDGDREPPPRVDDKRETTPSEERSRYNTVVAVTSDGRSIVAVHGMWLSGLEPDVAHVVDTASGEVVHSFIGDVDTLGSVTQVVTTPSSRAVAMLHVVHTRNVGSAFLGLSTLDPDTGKVAQVYDVSSSSLGDDYPHIKALDPGAFAVTSTSLLIAPHADAGVGDESSTPLEWHTDDRPRVREMEQYMSEISASDDP